MRTTVNLPEDLLQTLKERAASTGRTLASVMEDALRESLARRAEPRAPVQLPVFEGTGLMPGVDLDDSAALLDLMEGRDQP